MYTCWQFLSVFNGKNYIKSDLLNIGAETKTKRQQADSFHVPTLDGCHAKYKIPTYHSFGQPGYFIRYIVKRLPV